MEVTCNFLTVISDLPFNIEQVRLKNFILNIVKVEISTVSDEEMIKLWDESKIFESNVAHKKPKYFITVPYPYTSGALHIGHARSYTLGDVTARYYRLKGFNVLFPMAFHITGTPILAISKRIARGDKKMLAMHKEYISIYEEDENKANEIVESFKNPEALANYYANVIIADFKRMGYSIDWRRKFNTGEKFYNKFVEWQYKKFASQNLIIKGKHAVYFCPSCSNPVTTDDIKGGDELDIKMTEYYLIKEKIASENDNENCYLIAATLRPETVFGITNLWVNPEKIYVKVNVRNGRIDEMWLISKKASEKLKKQGFEVNIVDEFKGENLIGKKAMTPLTNKEVEILKANFVDDDVATGVVNSVPGHAPYDYVALRDSGINFDKEPNFRMIDSKIKVEEVVKDIKNQTDEKLEGVTQELYKDEFYNGIMNENCGEFKGMKVAVAKEKIAERLKSLNLLSKIYENGIKDKDGNVIKGTCRCGTELEIRVLEDQWFLNYTNDGWKNLAKKILKSIKIEPEIYRTGFVNAIEWLHEWPCTRNRGLGTKFPLDNKWMIESLSDSTIYMAFYTIAHLLRNLTIEELDEKFFDFIFLGKEFEGCEKYKNIREIFLYYYPMDERRTGIAHISNHLTFSLFHHAAIFPENLWPKKISLNEMLISEGKKMSKSLGNVIPLKHACEEFGADTVRLHLCYAADTSSTLDWKEKDVLATKSKIDEFVNFIKSADGCASYEYKDMDKWLISKFNKHLEEFLNLMDKSEIRGAVQKIFYEFFNDIKWYLRRTEPNKKVPKEISEEWVKVMSIFIPFTCERLQRYIGKGNFVNAEDSLKVDKEAINGNAESMENMIIELIDNIRNFVKLIEKHKKPTKVFIYFAEDWKRELFSEIKKGKGIKDVMADEKFKRHSKEVINIMKKTHQQDIKFIPSIEEESGKIEGAKEFLEKELNLKVEISVNADYDPKETRKFAMPLKPAIYIE
ncbi:Leucine--tRNA ligase [groundwater metagenome]|uniref:leucine--tRNA ligase n=1 Tax=groundwater metagenome TaxID=717931 RepID=A0A098E662_9ZZZZ